MGENDDLSDWYEENIETNLQDAIEPELGRIKDVFQDIDGEIVPSNNTISIAKQICSITIGKAVASIAGKRDNAEISIEEFYSAIDDDEKNIRANLSNMKSKGFLKKVEQGKYKVNPSKVSELLDYVLGGRDE